MLHACMQIWSDAGGDGLVLGFDVLPLFLIFLEGPHGSYLNDRMRRLRRSKSKDFAVHTSRETRLLRSRRGVYGSQPSER